MFNRLLMVAVIAGLLTAIVTTAVQLTWAVPLIQAAETYEIPAGASIAAEEGHTHAHAHSHEHPTSDAGWAPSDGLERTFWTFMTNLTLSLGVSLVMAALMLARGGASTRVGLLLGLAGYLVFTVAPALGLPPELPGTAAAALESRQLWWLLTVSCTLCAVWLLMSARFSWRWPAAIVLAIIPHMVGAPHPEIQQALAPESLQQEFIVASLISMFVFWVVVGASTGSIFERLWRDRSLSGAAEGV